MSILNKIKITAQLKQQRNALEALRSKQAEFDKRKAELETAIGEAESDEDIAAVNAEVEKLQAEEKEDGLADKITEVETGIAKLEEELGNEEAQTEKEQPQQAERNKDMSEMNKYKARELFRTGEYYERAEVKDFYEKLKNLRAVSGGSLTIPDVVIYRIHDIMGDYVTLYPLVDIIRVKGEARILLDTDTAAATWMEQGAAIADGNVGTITNVDFDGFKVGKVVFVDNYMMQDSLINLDEYVTKKLARAIALAVDAAILNGTGSANYQPTGIIPSLDATHSVGVEASASTLIDTVKNISLIDTGADSVGEIVAVMKRSTYYNIFFEYSVQVNSSGNVVGKLPNLTNPDLLGIRVVFNNNMADNTVLFGDFKKYTLVERESLGIDRSEHYKFKEDQTSFRGKARYDGKPVDADAFVLVTITAPASADTSADPSADTSADQSVGE